MDGWNSDFQNSSKNKKGIWNRDTDKPISLLGGIASGRPTALLICDRCPWHGTGACERCDPYTGARMV